MLSLEKTALEYSELLKMVHKRTRRLFSLMFQIHTIIEKNSDKYEYSIDRHFFKATNFEIYIGQDWKIDYYLEDNALLLLLVSSKNWPRNSTDNFILHDRLNTQSMFECFTRHYSEYNNTNIRYRYDYRHFVRTPFGQGKLMTIKKIKSLTEDEMFNLVLEHGSNIELLAVDAGLHDYNRQSMYVHYVLANPASVHDKVLKGFDELDERLFSTIRGMKAEPDYQDRYITCTPIKS